MAGKRKDRPVQMAGLFDWLDIFGPEPTKPKKDLPALPAPKSQLPSLRKEERGLVARAPGESLKEKLLSIFDVFGPPSRKEERTERLPAVPQEEPKEFAETQETAWDVLFSPEAEERTSLIEALPEREEAAPKYKIVHGGISRIPYESAGWDFPSIPEMAEHMKRTIDLRKVFEELADIRSTEGYQDMIADAAFRGVPLYTPISVIDDANYYSDFAHFYAIPWSLVEQTRSPEEFKLNFLNPLGIILTEAFEILKPEYLPGFFTIDYNSEDGRHWLYYVEPWLGRLPGP